jgi:hypothetical protein
MGAVLAGGLTAAGAIVCGIGAWLPAPWSSGFLAAGFIMLGGGLVLIVAERTSR